MTMIVILSAGRISPSAKEGIYETASFTRMLWHHEVVTPTTVSKLDAGCIHLLIAQTEDEYSIVCPQEAIPADMAYDADWRCLRVDGDLAYNEIGVVARVSKPLADAGMSLFLVSTHDRDYVFVADKDLQRAIDVYKSSGFEITTPTKDT